MSGNKDKLIAFNYFGGKFVWLEYLYDNFPPHFTHLIDLFAGSLCVSLNYRGRVIRTANEINGEITNFFEILRDQNYNWSLCIVYRKNSYMSDRVRTLISCIEQVVNPPV